MITKELLHTLFPKVAQPTLDGMVDPLQKTCDAYSINTINRVASFLAQTGHESAGFTARVENLNYSAKSLVAVFHKYFPTDALANAYARQPQKIASRVYANRMGNGDEASGDGWTYRGRGLIQCTGRNNYTAFATDRGMTVTDVVPYMETPEGAAMSAGWYWNANNLNDYADKSDIVGQTKVINGGTNGLDDRQSIYDAARQYLTTHAA